jgi:DNA-binding MarR family transcriptional regulator
VRDLDADILGHLRDVPPSQNYITAMASNLGVAQSTVRSHLKVMQDDGWVRRYPSALIEGNANIWELTDKGREVVAWRTRSL